MNLLAQAETVAEPDLVSTLIGGYLMLLLAVSLSTWFWLAQRRQQLGYLLPQTIRTLPPWGATEIALLILLWMFSQLAGARLASEFGGFELDGGFDKLSARQQGVLIGGTTLVQWAVMGVFVLWLVFKCRASWADIGLSSDGLGRDVVIGVTGFVLIMPPVMSLQAFLASLYPDEKHPFIEAMDGGVDAALMAGIVFAAVLTAPILEELMFRVVIQGWFEKLSGEIKGDATANQSIAAATDEASDAASLTDHEAAEAITPRADGPPEIASNPYASPQTEGLSSQPAKSTQQATAEESSPGPLSQWRPLAIVFSSLLFGLVHLGHGPAPISLFFLALGLGYIYQRTRRLLPCIIIHMLLNGQTTLVLFLGAASN